jgi:hypothetical protein
MSRTDNFTSTYNSDNISQQSDEYLHDDLKNIIDNKVKHHKYDGNIISKLTD